MSRRVPGEIPVPPRIGKEKDWNSPVSFHRGRSWFFICGQTLCVNKSGAWQQCMGMVWPLTLKVLESYIMRLLKVITPLEVFEIIRKNFSAGETELVSLPEAGGRICSEDIIAREDVPGFDRSTVDGYAVRAVDTFGANEVLPAILKLTGEVEMGCEAPSLTEGSCIYVPTGGMLPKGSDAVIMIENTETSASEISSFCQVAPGENVILRGQDISSGELIINKGKRLRAQEIGVLASLGSTKLKVFKRPRVGILSTGNEIVPYSTPVLEHGRVRDSNALAVGELVRQRGGQPVFGGILEDIYPVFRSGVESLLAEVDFLVLSGGSSVGFRDFTLKILQELSDDHLLVEGIAVQPGKPTLLANCKGKPVLGLPGHPASALNIFRLFGSLLIDQLQGLRGEGYNPTIRGILTRNIPSSIGRTDYVRVRLDKNDNQIDVTPLFGRSGLLRTLVEAQGVVVVPSGSEGLTAGSYIEVFLLD